MEDEKKKKKREITICYLFHYADFSSFSILTVTKIRLASTNRIFVFLIIIV